MYMFVVKIPVRFDGISDSVFSIVISDTLTIDSRK